MRNHLIGAWRALKRVLLFVIGALFVFIDEWVFDEYIFGNVVAFATSYGLATIDGHVPPEQVQLWGRVLGGVISFGIIAPVAGVMCYLYILAYDWLKIDWFSMERLKTLREEEGKGWFTKLLKRFVALGDIPAFFILSIWKDAFITTTYLRHGAHEYGGLTKRDWRIFRWSLIVSAGYWTLRWSLIVFLVQVLFPHLPLEVQNFLLWCWELNLAVLHWLQGWWEYFVQQGGELAKRLSEMLQP